MASRAAASGIGADSVLRSSARIWCAEREVPAVVSVVERDLGGTCLRFVQWCSVLGCDACTERCLSALRTSMRCAPCPPTGAVDPPAAPAPPNWQGAQSEAERFARNLVRRAR